MGVIQLQWNGSTTTLDPRPGAHIWYHNGLLIKYRSELTHPNIWRVRFLEWEKHVEETSPTRLTISGNLGGSNISIPLALSTDVNGYEIPYWSFADDLTQPQRPPSTLFVLPPTSSVYDEIDVSLTADQFSLSWDDFHLPFTFYLAHSYLPRSRIVEEIVDDFDLFRGEAHSFVDANELRPSSGFEVGVWTELP